MIVALTDAEIRICEWVGKMRDQNARSRHRNPGAGPSATTMDASNHIRGAKCEFAASVLLNLYWRPAVGEIDQPDVGGFVEVRSTELPNGRLIVKPDDNDSSPFVLMIQVSPTTFKFGGWTHAWAAKKHPLLTQHGDPAHFVPQGSLLHIDTLMQIVASRPR